MALTISPDKPVVAVGQRITLTANGATGNVRWQAFDGSIPINSGNQITYIAPDKAGLDSITVKDDTSSTMVNIVITQPQTEIKPENAVWEVFTNRNKIQALLLSEDKKTLWVGTNGGLEKRDAETGKVYKVFNNLDGLPNHEISSLLSNSNGGIWIGTSEGLAHFDINGKWTVFNKTNSSLPDNNIQSLLSDGQGGLWIGTYEGLVHYDINGKWTVFNKTNSSLPDNSIWNLLSDGKGGIWIGTSGGLAYFDVNGKWVAFNKTNSELSDNYVGNLLSDSNDGIWIGTSWGGLAHFDVNGKWTVLNTGNSELPSDSINSLLSDGKGGIWIGTRKGLAHYDTNGKWTVFNKNNSKLPSNYAGNLLSDSNGGIWIETSEGLAHFDANGKWTTFNDDSVLPSNSVGSLLSDDKGGIWVGTFGGVVHLDVNGKWTTSLSGNNLSILSLLNDGQGGVWAGDWKSGLIHYDINGKWTTLLSGDAILSLLNDGQGGIWIGTEFNGLVHFDVNGKMNVFNEKNSGLPFNKVESLLSDEQGGLWIGTFGGLAHYDVSGKWTIFNKENSGLSNDGILALLSDNNEGILVGTNEGLIHFDVNGKWTTLLSGNAITSLLNDGQGGLWGGAWNSGLVHYGINGKWTVFNKDNSGLPTNNFIRRLLSDGKGGLWIGTDEIGKGSGLAHLTFTNKTALCQQSAQQDCSALQNNKRGAILIAGGGSESSNTLWDTTYNISNTIYRMLTERGFNNDEVYYLSPVDWADFNGDGFNDRIVDAPKADRGLEAGDIQKALEWAKQRGKLDQPLYIFFVDHGGEDKLQLSKDNTLAVEQFKQILDDYQTTTGNEIVLVIDACFSGVLGEKLKADKRAIISSTYNGSAYFNRLDKQGFSSFLVYWLNRGMNFSEAFDLAGKDQKKLLNNMNLRVVVTGSTGSDSGVVEQIPKKFDQNQILDKLFLNGGFMTGDATLSVKNITTSTQIKANIPFNLKAQASVAQGDVKEVWAVVRPPRMDLILDSYNTPILAFPRVILGQTKGTNEWEGTLSNTRYNGDYKITFYAKDRDGDVVSSDETITLTVSDGIEPPPQATLQIQLNQTNYKAGDLFKATITEELQWGYDLYVAVILPSGDFITLKGKNGFSNLNEIKIWYGNRSQGITNPFLELTLPALPAGQYCLFGALSPEGEPPLNATKYWKQTTQCFTLN